MKSDEKAALAAQTAILSAEAAGEALASGASEKAVVLAGTATAAMARIQRRLVEQHGVAGAAHLLHRLLRSRDAALVACDEDDLIREIRGWCCNDA